MYNRGTGGYHVFLFYYEPYIALLGHLNTDEDYETAQKALKSINKKYQKELVQSCTLVQKMNFTDCCGRDRF